FVSVAGAEALDQLAVVAAVGAALVHSAAIAFAAGVAPGPTHGAVRGRSDANANVAEGLLDLAFARVLAALTQRTDFRLVFGIVVLRPAVIGVRTGRERAPGAGHGGCRREQQESASKDGVFEVDFHGCPDLTVLNTRQNYQRGRARLSIQPFAEACFNLAAWLGGHRRQPWNLKKTAPAGAAFSSCRKCGPSAPSNRSLPHRQRARPPGPPRRRAWPPPRPRQSARACARSRAPAPRPCVAPARSPGPF